MVILEGESSKMTRGQRRRANKRKAESAERKEIEEGRMTKEEVAKEKAVRRAEEEERFLGKIERGRHLAR